MKQLIRFIVVGIFNTAFGYGIIFFCMYALRMTPEISNILGYAISLGVSYLLHKKITFESDRQHRKEAIRFLVVFAISYAVNLLLLVLLVHEIHLNKGVSQVFAGAAYVSVSFLLNKFYVFKTSTRAANT